MKFKDLKKVVIKFKEVPGEFSTIKAMREYDIIINEKVAGRAKRRPIPGNKHGAHWYEVDIPKLFSGVSDSLATLKSDIGDAIEDI